MIVFVIKMTVSISQFQCKILFEKQPKLGQKEIPFLAGGLVCRAMSKNIFANQDDCFECNKKNTRKNCTVSSKIKKLKIVGNLDLIVIQITF